jgi:hypothetical protein
VIGVFEFGDVGQADDVLLVLRKHCDGGSQNLDGAFLGFAHNVGLWSWKSPNPSNSRGLTMADSP